MKECTLLALCAAAALLSAQAQEMDVIRMDGQVDEFNLAEIDSITFSVHQSLTAPALRSGLRGANDILCVHTESDVVQFAVPEIDSICYDDPELVTIHHGTGEWTQFSLVEVDSMSFTSSLASVVSITYSGTSVIVDNPFEALGVSIEVEGAHVTVTSATAVDGITYALSGSTTDGMFKIYAISDFALHAPVARIEDQSGEVHGSSSLSGGAGIKTVFTRRGAKLRVAKDSG